jgi:hypothetical protein
MAAPRATARSGRGSRTRAGQAPCRRTTSRTRGAGPSAAARSTPTTPSPSPGRHGSGARPLPARAAGPGPSPRVPVSRPSSDSAQAPPDAAAEAGLVTARAEIPGRRTRPRRRAATGGRSPRRSCRLAAAWRPPRRARRRRRAPCTAPRSPRTAIAPRRCRGGGRAPRRAAARCLGRTACAAASQATPWSAWPAPPPPGTRRPIAAAGTVAPPSGRIPRVRRRSR